MATERQLQFRVGMLVVIAASVCVGLVIRFGEAQNLWKKRYPLTIQLENSGGLYPSAPVTLSGLGIGSVKLIELNQSRGGVNVQIEIQEKIRLPVDSRAVVSRSLMGETAIEIISGNDADMLAAGGRIVGVAAADPMVMIQRLEVRTSDTLQAFADTGQEWQLVAKNINTLLDTKRGHLNDVVESAADSLHEFTKTMKAANQMLGSANEIVADPAAQRAMKDTLVALPNLVMTAKSAIEETRQTIISTRQVLDGMNRNLVNLSQVTEPVGKKGEQIVGRLENTMTNFDQLITELNRFMRTVNHKEGSLQQFIGNPSLYNNLDRSSQSLMVLLKHLEPVLKDMREFSDKVARNPELLGVGGAVRPSKGLKDEEILDPAKKPTPARTTSVRSNNPPR